MHITLPYVVAENVPHEKTRQVAKDMVDAEVAYRPSTYVKLPGGEGGLSTVCGDRVRHNGEGAFFNSVHTLHLRHPGIRWSIVFED